MVRNLVLEGDLHYWTLDFINNVFLPQVSGKPVLEVDEKNEKFRIYDERD